MVGTRHPWHRRARVTRHSRRARPRAESRASSCVGSRRRSQAGETLIETLCTLTIVSLGIVALVLAMGYDFRFDRQSRSSAQADSLLVAFGENLQSLTYEACTSSSTPYSTTATSALPTQLQGITVIGSGSASGPNQYLATVTAVQYWDGNANPIGWSSSCPSSGDSGVQQLSLSVTPGDSAVTRTLTIVKRQT